ncbi:MAG: metallophosphoesterase N-terminal domain-containing protein, partial [Segatella copri]
MKRKLLYIGGILLVCCMLVAIGMTMRLNEEITTLPAIGPKIAANIHYHPQMKDSIQKPKPVVKKMDFNISGTLLDTDGKGVTGVIVSDGYHCVKTDSSGRYKMKRDSLARFIYYSVPADCEVPTHSETDRTACFYQAVSNDKKKYDFTLTRLPGGKEVSYKMIVIGDPQVTNAYSPYYTSPDDNPIKKSDVERFTTQTMADIKQTIKSLPAGTPVYGLSMGDDVQYYGGYNAKLERQIRQALGSSEMRLFSVIGNHDQDGKALYRRKWEENFGPTDFSFDRGDVHYVCINNCFFHRGMSYYSPGELRERQVKWLKQNLALTPKDKKVVLCYHIPFTFGNAPFSK